MSFQSLEYVLESIFEKRMRGIRTYKKLAASGIIVIIIGCFLIIFSKEGVTQIENLLSYLIGYVMGIIGLVSISIALTKIIAERL